MSHGPTHVGRGITTSSVIATEGRLAHSLSAIPATRPECTAEGCRSSHYRWRRQSDIRLSVCLESREEDIHASKITSVAGGGAYTSYCDYKLHDRRRTESGDGVEERLLGLAGRRRVDADQRGGIGVA